MASRSSVVLLTVFVLASNLSLCHSDCPKRRVITDTSGYITLGNSDYSVNTYCQWLIEGGPGQFINLHFDYFLTECDYDFLYVYGGNSFSSRLIGSFSGATLPDSLSISAADSNTPPYALIHFYSDLNVKPKNGSFRIQYEITDCKFGCSPCSSRQCLCTGGHTGLGCEVEQCRTASDCNNQGACVTDPLDAKDYCKCNQGFTGRRCDLDLTGPSLGQGRWTELASAGTGFVNRTGHSLVYDEAEENLWIFGGYSLSTVTNQLLRFNMTSSHWELEPIVGAWPDKSYNHKAVVTSSAVGGANAGCMFISGGRDNDAVLSQFWRYCFANNSWTELEDLPHRITDHTMTVVDDRWIYIMGGLTDNQTLSSELWRYDLTSGSVWEVVPVRGGKVLDVRGAAHSAVYHNNSRSLLIFGGHRPSVPRFTQHSKDLYTFHVDKQIWSEIDYPTSNGPPAVAYHSANLIGDYMVIYGGQIKRTQDKPCHSSTLYAYNIVCHQWVSISSMYKSLQITEPTDAPTSKGRYSHSSVLINGNILVISGGYRGNVLGDLWAYQVLSPISLNTNDIAYGSSVCSSHTRTEGCIADSGCFWCPAPPYSGCTEQENLGNCPTNPQSRCPGLCSTLTDCQSCVVQGELEQCAWCIHDQTCQQSQSLTDTCSSPAPEPVGWWRGGVRVAYNQSQCVSDDNRPAGITYASYLSDPESGNPPLPHTVQRVQDSTMEWKAEKNHDGMDFSVARFYIHPNYITLRNIDLWLQAQNNIANISIVYNGVKVNLAEVIPSGISLQQAELIYNNSGQSEPILPDVDRGTKYLTEIRVRLEDYLSPTVYGLRWNARAQDSKDLLAKEYLEPYSGGNCSTHQSCLSCQLDAGCGWCPLTSLCVSRSASTLQSDECGGDDPDHWLITEISQCAVCSDYTDCQECTQSGVCEWNSTRLLCVTRGLDPRLNHSITDSTSCPSYCNERDNCSSCLEHQDECIWCESSQSCDQFAPYLAINSYAQCKSWRENHQQQGVCITCESYTNCSDCLSHSNCGWCGNDFNPNIGVCTSGDYSTPANCSAILSSHMDVSAELLALNLSLTLVNSSNSDELSENATFSYETCPDVLECLLGIAECDGNSTCRNTAEGYECDCNRGFEGDGRIACNRTCYYDCVYGACSGDPDYECNCDLGWTNITCDTNCGCNNHSTCLNGTGICDSCQEYTQGVHCEYCVPGSYGDATVSPGCLPCQCNGHGRVHLDLCNITTGVCYCEDGFLGDHCDMCDITATGDPRDGGLCYSYSHSRLVLLNVSGVGGVTSQAKYGECPYTSFIISPYNDLHRTSISNTPVMTVTIDSVNTTCPTGFAYVYDGLDTDEDSLGYTAAFCGSVYDDPTLNSVDIYSGYATILFFGNSSEGETLTARYTVHNCNSSCHGNRMCDGNDNCICQTGYRGVDCGIEICPNNCTGNGQCDMNTESCICDVGFTGEDCSQESHFTLNLLLDGSLAAHSPPPRHGFTVADCGTEGLLLFGGLSLVDGPLNDLWKFDGQQWLELSPATSNSPSGRYLHTAVCTDEYLIVHGGLVMMSSTSQPITSNETWTFYFDTETWYQKLFPGAPDLAGHTMTHLPDTHTLILIGGYSTITDWNNQTYTYQYQQEKWKLQSQATGAVPAGLLLHTAVYHSASEALYIHGGYRYYIDKQFVSNETFFYNVTEHRWFKRPDDARSSAYKRYAHSSIQIDNRMVVIGGLETQNEYEMSISMYSYACDTWHDIGLLPVPMSGHVAIHNDSQTYIFSSDTSAFYVHSMVLPGNVCSIYSSDTPTSCLSQRGCHSCNTSGYFYCFDKIAGPPAECTVGNTTQILATSDTCDISIVTERDCNSHGDCAQCLSAWPYHGHVQQKCKWCSFCNVGLCIEVDQDCAVENPCSRPQSAKLTADTCLEQRCRSATCQQCQTEAQDKEGCIWSRQFMRSSEVKVKVSAAPFENWNCVTGLLIKISTIPSWSAPPQTCPAPCQTRTDCTSCLESDGGGVGGVASCYWSSRLNSCMPPSLLPLLCDTGLCAPLLPSGDTSLCPKPCSQYTQCGQCLAQPHCGWCSDGSQSTGAGVCLEGLDSGPTSGVCGSGMSTADPSAGVILASSVPCEWMNGTGKLAPLISGDTWSLTTSTEEDCRAHCTNQTSFICAAVNYRQSDSVCELLTESDQTGTVETTLTGWEYFIRPLCAGIWFPWKAVRRQRINDTANRIDQTTGSTLRDCMSGCLHIVPPNSTCSSISIGSDDNTCDRYNVTIRESRATSVETEEWLSFNTPLWYRTSSPGVSAGHELRKRNSFGPTLRIFNDVKITIDGYLIGWQYYLVNVPLHELCNTSYVSIWGVRNQLNTYDHITSTLLRPENPSVHGIRFQFVQDELIHVRVNDLIGMYGYECTTLQKHAVSGEAIDPAPDNTEKRRPFSLDSFINPKFENDAVGRGLNISLSAFVAGYTKLLSPPSSSHASVSFGQIRLIIPALTNSESLGAVYYRIMCSADSSFSQSYYCHDELVPAGTTEVILDGLNITTPLYASVRVVRNFKGEEHVDDVKNTTTTFCAERRELMEDQITISITEHNNDTAAIRLLLGTSWADDDCISTVSIIHGAERFNFSEKIQDSIQFTVNTSSLYMFSMTVTLKDGHEIKYWEGSLDLRLPKTTGDLRPPPTTGDPGKPSSSSVSQSTVTIALSVVCGLLLLIGGVIVAVLLRRIKSSKRNPTTLVSAEMVGENGFQAASESNHNGKGKAPADYETLGENELNDHEYERPDTLPTTQGTTHTNYENIAASKDDQEYATVS